jgi:hypothetical protein
MTLSNGKVQDSPHGNSFHTNQLPPCQHVHQRRQRNPARGFHRNQTRKNERLPLSVWALSRPVRRTEKSGDQMTKNLASPWRVRLHERNDHWVKDIR